MTKDRMLVENGDQQITKIVSLEHPHIAKHRKALENEGGGNLVLVGRLDNGNYIETQHAKHDFPRRMNKSFKDLDPRAIILEDGRVFVDERYEDPEASDSTCIRNLVQCLFMGYSPFSDRFRQLYDAYNLNLK